MAVKPKPPSFLILLLRILPVVLPALVPLPAQEGSALISALVRKGILTLQEAEEIRAEVVRGEQSAPVAIEPDGKSTRQLTVGMRLQIQHAHLDTDVSGRGADPASTSHAFLRRMYLTLGAALAENWSAEFTYDFAGAAYDAAFVQWKPNADLTLDFGLRKVNVAHEERASSGDIRAIERSSITRYFVEENNGRRLGAASYRVGVFLDGRRRMNEAVQLVYGAAITNPERSETFSDAADSGDRGTNRPALWANLGLSGRLVHDGSWTVGVGSGFLPDQGGADVDQRGSGSDLSLHSLFVSIEAGRFEMMAEYLAAGVDHGTREGADATPRGFFIQPSLRLSDTVEAVVRYAWLDSDGRGVTLADVVRSAPSGGVMNTFNEWYAGASWYLQGNDLKLQLGAVYGKTREVPTGGPAEAEAVGVRSQVQMQF